MIRAVVGLVSIGCNASEKKEKTGLYHCEAVFFLIGRVSNRVEIDWRVFALNKYANGTTSMQDK